MKYKIKRIMQLTIFFNHEKRYQLYTYMFYRKLLRPDVYTELLIEIIRINNNNNDRN